MTLVNDYLPLILQSIGTIATVITVFSRLQKQTAEKHKAELKLLEDRFKEELQRQKEELPRIHEDIKDLESKISKQDDFIKEYIIGKLSSLESSMKSVTNILNVIQEHFIKKGAN